MIFPRRMSTLNYVHPLGDVMSALLNRAVFQSSWWTATDASTIMSQIYESPYQIDIPTVDLPSFIFSGTTHTHSQPQYFDADNPAQNFSLEQAEQWVKRWAKGLNDFGIGPGDKVMLVSGNSLYFPILLWGVLASGGVFTGCSPASSVTGRYTTVLGQP